MGVVQALLNTYKQEMNGRVTAYFTHKRDGVKITENVLTQKHPWIANNIDSGATFFVDFHDWINILIIRDVGPWVKYSWGSPQNV